jgi:hypothetical protein
MARNASISGEHTAGRGVAHNEGPSEANHLSSAASSRQIGLRANFAVAARWLAHPQGLGLEPRRDLRVAVGRLERRVPEPAARMTLTSTPDSNSRPHTHAHPSAERSQAEAARAGCDTLADSDCIAVFGRRDQALREMESC